MTAIAFPTPSFSASACKHVVTPLLREDDGTVYASACSCGASWKVYQSEHHVDADGHAVSGVKAVEAGAKKRSEWLWAPEGRRFQRAVARWQRQAGMPV